MKKILFIITPVVPFNNINDTIETKMTYYIPQPLGLCYLGSIFRNNDYEVEIYDPMIENHKEFEENGQDIDMLKNRIIEGINEKDFDFIGISCPYIYTYKWAHFIAEIVKNKSKEIPVFIGNGYASLLKEKVLQDKNIDYLIIGEGEESTLKLVELLEKNNFEEIKKIDGIGYRRDGEIIINEKISFIKNPDELPLPAWDLIDYEKYMSFEGKRTLIMQATRGCPYSCTFCNSFESWGRNFRKRSPNSIMKEVDYLIKYFNVEDILFIDDNLTVDKNLVLYISKEMKKRGITWRVVNISSFIVDKEMLLAMKESGCNSISIAVESASPKILKEIRKPVNLERTKEIIKWCRELNLPIRIFYITGMPYETKEDILTTLKYSEEARGDWNQYSLLIPYPGTDIYTTCIEKGYISDQTLDLESLGNLKKGFISTEEWDLEWVREITYEYNIRTNFLNNYNITEKDGNLNYIINFFEYVYRFHQEHVIATICLGYAYYLKENIADAHKFFDKAKEMLNQKEIKDTFGKYLSYNQYEVIRFFNEYCSNCNI